MTPLEYVGPLPFSAKTANLGGMESDFLTPFQQMAQDYYDQTGKALTINDAFRTREQQAEGYRRKPNLVAPPGHSLHEKGLAMDIDSDQANELDKLGLFDKYGFYRPMMTKAPGHKYEPWHIQLRPKEEGVLAKVGEALGPSSAEAAGLPKGKLQFVGEGDLTKSQPKGKLQFFGEGDLTKETIPRVHGAQPVMPEGELPFTQPREYEQPKSQVYEGKIEKEVPITPDTLAEFSGPAGDMVGQAIDVPFIPLHMARDYVVKQAEKLGGPFTMRPEMSFGDLVKSMLGKETRGDEPPTMAELAGGAAELLVFPKYTKGLIKGGEYLGDIGKMSFYRYAPDMVFKSTAKGGLPYKPLSEGEWARLSPEAKEAMMQDRITPESGVKAPVKPETPPAPKPVVEPEPQPAPEKVGPGEAAMTFDQFSESRGVSRHPPSFPESHRAPGGVSKQSAKKMAERIATANAEWDAARTSLREEYQTLKDQGEIREPTRQEQLEETAKLDTEAGAAARRLLAKAQPPQAKAAAKEAWELTRDEHIESLYQKAKARYPNAPDEDLRKTALIQSTERDQALMERAKVGRIPDNVLDDIVERNGLSALRSFRGIYEKGAEGYLPPDVRAEEVKTTTKPKEKWEKTWIEFRKDQTDAVPRKLTKAEFAQDKKRHHDIVAKALYEGKTVPPEVLKDYKDLLNIPKRLEGNASIPKSSRDSLSSDPHALRDFVETDAFRKHGLDGFDVPSQGLVMSRVLAALHQPEIRDAVIKTVPVDVVNDVIVAKSPTDVLLHDKSVFHNKSAVNLDDTVSLRSDSADSLVRSTAKAVAERPDLKIPQFGGLPIQDTSAELAKGFHKETVPDRGAGVKTDLQPKAGAGEPQAKFIKSYSLKTGQRFHRFEVDGKTIDIKIKDKSGDLNRLSKAEAKQEAINKIGQGKLYSGGPEFSDIKAGVKKIANLPWPKEVKEWTLQTFLPSAKSPLHLEAAVDLGGEMGASNRRAEVSHNALKATSKALDKLGIHDPALPPEDNVGFQFASNMSTGKPQPTPALQNIDTQVRKLFDERVKLLDEKGAPLPPEKVRENYFPGMWEKKSVRAFNQAIAEGIARGAIDAETFDPNTASEQTRIAIKMRVKDLLSSGEGSDNDALQYFSRKPMKGGESFRKQKVFNDWQVGIDYGLVPISNNPLDLVRMKLAELDRSIMMNGFLRIQEAKGNVINTTLSGLPMKEADLATFNPGEWTRLPDDEPYGKIWAREGGVLKLVGYRMFKKPVADILKNYLSQGWMSNPLYRGVMAVGNSLNQSQLGLGSLFHGGFTTIEAQINAGADVIQDIYGVARGNRTVGQLAKTMLKWPVAMGTTPFKGGQVLKEWRNPTIEIPENVPVGQLLQDNRFPQPVTRVQLIAKAVELAGGRTTMEVGLRTQQQEKMLRDWYGGKKLKAALRSPIALTELSMKPLMMAYVPRQKLAVFGEMVGRILDQNPGKTMDELKGLFRERYNHVEATLGQVSYDRLFMHNAAKNAVQMLIRAPGWTGGTIVEVGGAPVDAAKFFNDWAKTGKPPEQFPRKLAYVLSLAATIMGTNALLTKAFTGKYPETFKDALTFKDARGQVWMLPSYMKDMYSWATNAGHTAVAKMHPMFSIMGEIARGTDYYGTQIRNPEDPYLTQLKDSLIHGVKSFEPFWTRGAKKAGEKEGGVMATLQKDPAKILAPEIGIMPAPRAYTTTAADKVMDTYNESMGQPVRSPEDQELYKLRKRAGELVREGKRREAWELIKPTVQEKKIPEAKAVKWLRDSEEDPQVRRFKSMTRTVGGKDGLGWQLKALSVAKDEEFDKLAPVVMKRIQNALDKGNTETLEKNKAAIQQFGAQFRAYKARTAKQQVDQINQELERRRNAR